MEFLSTGRRLTVAVVVGLVAAGCTGAGPAEESPSEPVASNAVSTTEGATPGSTTSSGTAEHGDATSTSPEGEPVGSTPRDVLTYEDYLDYLARLHRIEDPPEVEMIREVRQSEWGEVLIPCMAEFGFEVSIDEQGGWGGEYPSDQEEAYREAAFICEASYPLLPELYRPWDEATLQRVHGYLAAEVVPCVEGAGYSFELPTYETFRSRYAQDRSYTIGLEEAALTSGAAERCGINIPDAVLLDE